jgi:hypothetical protein
VSVQPRLPEMCQDQRVCHGPGPIVPTRCKLKLFNLSTPATAVSELETGVLVELGTSRNEYTYIVNGLVKKFLCFMEHKV